MQFERPPLKRLARMLGHRRVINLNVYGVPREQLRVSVVHRMVHVTTAGECLRQVNATFLMPFHVDVRASRARIDHRVLTLELAAASAPQEGTLSIRADGRQLPGLVHTLVRRAKNILRCFTRRRRTVLRGLENLAH